MNSTDILRWIKNNLSGDIRQAIKDSGVTLYTEEWLAGMICRETGGLIARYAPVQRDVKAIATVMMGDFTQRKGETEKQYHGFGFIQIDRQAYPAFVMSGKWKIPVENFKGAIRILEEKRTYLLSKFPDLDSYQQLHYATAAFNCGQGNEAKVINVHLNPDAYTAGHDYSKAVEAFSETYKSFYDQD